MCGFVAMFSNNQEQLNEFPLEKMTNSITHRGPDDCGYFQHPYVRFGFRRLSIIDLENGHQPMQYDNDRYTIVFNGEIYNAPELRKSLIEEGLEFDTYSDTEVILAIFRQKGKKGFSLLRGMFAFLIWDRENETLTGARDPFGIKPFFYKKDRDSFLFASEKKSLLNTRGQRPESHNEIVDAYLTFQFAPEPYTTTTSIWKVPPGHMIEVKSDGDLQVDSYWKPNFKPDPMLSAKKAPEGSKAKVQAKIRSAIEESVALHLRSDVPVSTFLSGGIDSTAITALTKQHKPDLKSFTAEFVDYGYSEADVARKTADKLGIDHNVVTISVDQVMEALPKIIWHMDEPIADPAAIPLYFVAEETSKHSKVVLSGEGADELFGGYNIYREPHSLRMFDYLPVCVKRQLKLFASRLPQGIKGRSFLLRGCTPLEERFVGNARIFDPEETSQFLRERGGETALAYTKPLYDFAKRQGWDPVTTMQYVDMHTWLRGDILTKADKMTMAHSLELRVPFLDTGVFDPASTLPMSAKVNRKQTKVWMREALSDLVPDHVVERKKLGFPVPIRHWLKDEMYDWAKNILSQIDETKVVFDQKASLQLLEDHRNGKADYSRKIWTILTYILWHKQFIESTHRLRTIENDRLKDII
ncbi:asparagine synthase (glutamine-hydrolyzing) [Alteribacter populi]|uniref:asparagine synthase (glutamine-hydrolyzing) n=1 Tax=Alteribacter populi TaxID=2011011 RepID=UPI000BBAE657|nr:asparagine synthase (glutamine-hydrolyzing) [Alteribacter populi]